MTKRLVTLGGVLVVICAALAVVLLARGTSGNHGPVSNVEFAEMKAAVNQVAVDGHEFREVHLVNIEVAKTGVGTWAAAEDPTPAARLRVVFIRKAGTWTEVASSSGCLRESELGMPDAVEKKLRVCSVPG